MQAEVGGRGVELRGRGAVAVAIDAVALGAVLLVQRVGRASTDACVGVTGLPLRRVDRGGVRVDAEDEHGAAQAGAAVAKVDRDAVAGLLEPADLAR